MRTLGENEPEWMRCSFTPTVEDAAVFLRYHAANSVQVNDTIARGRKISYAISIPVVLILGGGIVLSGTPWGRWLEPYMRYGLPVLLVAGLLILAGFLVLNNFRLGQRSMIRRTFESQVRSGAIELDLRPMTASIDGSGLNVDRGTAAAWHSWRVIQRVVEFEERLLIYFTRDQAVVIPFHAFESPVVAGEFRRLVETNLRREPNNTAAPPTAAVKR